MRYKIWRVLFADSKIVYNKCAYDKDLTIERSQITQSCCLAYLDAFNLPWSQTTIKYIDCLPAPNNAALKEEFAASVLCRKLFPGLELELIDKRRASHIPRMLDVRGLRYFAPLEEVLIGPFCLDLRYLFAIPELNYHNADAVDLDELLLQVFIGWNSPTSRWAQYELGLFLLALVLRRNRK